MPDGLENGPYDTEKKVPVNGHTCVKIRVLESHDPSVQCIGAIQQVMDIFQTKGVFPGNKLSTNGKDTRAVYAWFMERYNPEVGIKVK